MEKLVKKWNADPRGDVTCELYQETGWKAFFRRLFGKRTTVDCPSAVITGFYEPGPLKLKSGQRLAVQGLP